MTAHDFRSQLFSSIQGNRGGDRGNLWYRYQLVRYQVSPKLKVLVPPIYEEGTINIVKLTMNMTNSEKRSMSVRCETNGQDQTTPEHVTVASVSLSALLKAKNLFSEFQNHPWTTVLLVPTHIAWYRYPYLWCQVPPYLHNVVPGTNPLVPWYD